MIKCDLFVSPIIITLLYIVLTIERERKGNFIQVSGEFDLSEFKLTKKKSGVKSKRNWT